jgi:hypothetical protein
VGSIGFSGYIMALHFIHAFGEGHKGCMVRQGWVEDGYKVTFELTFYIGLLSLVLFVLVVLFGAFSGMGLMSLIISFGSWLMNEYHDFRDYLEDCKVLSCWASSESSF